MLLIATLTLLILLALSGALPDTRQTPALGLLLYGGLLAALIALRLWLMASTRARLRAHFQTTLTRVLTGIGRFEDLCRGFESHHRPHPATPGALNQLDQFLSRVDEADPLLLWPHIDGGWHCDRAADGLLNLIEGLSEVSREPMGFKPQVQHAREAEIIQAAHALKDDLGALRDLARRHGRAHGDAMGYTLVVLCALTALWALSSALPL